MRKLFEAGRRYRVSFTPAAAKKPITMEGNYLGKNVMYEDAHDFDFRPQAGTTTLFLDRIKTITDIGPADYEGS
jgi:hypothetical protein